MSYSKLSAFSTIYVEKKAQKYQTTKSILNKFDKSTIIEIEHYKDIFSRFKSNYREQKESLKIILATKESNFLYSDTPMIQKQNMNNFFYTPTILNCLYDCEYCFLQGMYQSGYLVLFVNLDDFFDATLNKLNELNGQKMFLSISYDSDILALEGFCNITRSWINFAQKHKNLTMEIRTKSANYSKLKNITPSDNILLNWTLTPKEYVQKFEHHTATLTKRIENIKLALQDGWRVGIVIDPIIYDKNYKQIYKEFFVQIEDIEFTNIDSFVIGVFRMSSNHLKKIKKDGLQSSIIYYPYDKVDNYYSYNKNLSNQLVEFVTNEITKREKNTTIYTLEQ
jgi:spore photoproduct lyase